MTNFSVHTAEEQLISIQMDQIVELYMKKETLRKKIYNNETYGRMTYFGFPSAFSPIGALKEGNNVLVCQK